jgi:uncharacterized protein (DUF427 family)
MYPERLLATPGWQTAVVETARRIEPGPGQESVWDYPRPPRIERVTKPVVVVHAGTVIASSDRALRVLETSSPPTFYIPPGDVSLTALHPALHTSFCEWKGGAVYFDVEIDGNRSARAAWSYPDPKPAFRRLKDYISFYPARVGSCSVGGEIVLAQEGGFYGGWITKDIVGPFKGAPGTGGW